jgi:hypothetical protein
MIRQLPRIIYKGKEYFIDERLNEFRSNAKPFELIEFVPFDSRKGKKIIRRITNEY